MLNSVFSSRTPTHGFLCSSRAADSSEAIPRNSLLQQLAIPATACLAVNSPRRRQNVGVAFPWRGGCLTVNTVAYLDSDLSADFAISLHRHPAKTGLSHSFYLSVEQHRKSFLTEQLQNTAFVSIKMSLLINYETTDSNAGFLRADKQINATAEAL